MLAPHHLRRYGAAPIRAASRLRGALGVMKTDRSDDELMWAYVQGDAVAFGEIMTRFRPKLRNFMRRGLPNPTDVDDLVQQTFLHLHRARNDYQPSRPMRPWMFTIAYNLKREHLRRHKRRPTTALLREPTSRESTPSESAEAQQAQRRIHQVLRLLPESQREVIELHWFAGLSFAEVAQVVGAELSAVKVRAHRGYKAMRLAMEGQLL